jgi:GTPase SAR1 family protein
MKEKCPKIIIAGDSSVGKTCISTRLAINQFKVDTNATVNAAFFEYKVSKT